MQSNLPRPRKGVFALFLWGAALLLGGGLLPAAVTRQQRAWDILASGAKEKGVLKRADAVRALGLLPHDARARMMAEKALGDDHADVRAGAATALGEMHSVESIPGLVKALSDKDPIVVLEAAHSLLALQDQEAYDVYYAVLTGEQKGGRGLIGQEREMLYDPKKLAEFSIETGLGFVPFAGYGVAAYKAVTKGGADQARAAAAQVLAKDPDPRSLEALVVATSDHSSVVRIAALRAVATRGDPRLLIKIEPSMDDKQDAVRYVAAAAVIRLSEVRTSPRLSAAKHSLDSTRSQKPQ